MIAAEGICKRFGARSVLKDVSFRVEKGEIVVLMGENGAGKSTLFDILASIDPDFDGTASICGWDLHTHPREARGCIGYVPGRFSLYGDLSVAENLDFFAAAYGCDARDIASRSPFLWNGLAPFSGFRADTLSGGMRQKLAVCAALVHNPSVLLLDEPTVGIDPAARADVWKELSALRERGVSVLMSTHYLDEAPLADRILFLHAGEILLADSPAGMLRSFRHRIYNLPYPIAERPAAEAALEAMPGVLDHYPWGGSLHLVVDESFAAAPVCGRMPVPADPGVEDVFIDRLSQKEGHP